MTGPEHYREAERLLAAASDATTEGMTRARIAAAQTHATLALAAATVATRAFGPQEMWGGHSIEAGPEWQEATA